MIKKLLQKGIIAQRENKKKNITYLTFFQLNSSIQRKSYEIQINLYDREFYFDKEEVYILWIPKFLLEENERDREYLKKGRTRDISNTIFTDRGSKIRI